MLDIKWIRENADVLDAALAKRGAEPSSASLIAIDERRRTILQSLQDMQSRRNAASKDIGAAMAQKNNELAEKLKAEVAELKNSMPALEEESRQVEAELNDALSRLPEYSARRRPCWFGRGGQCRDTGYRCQTHLEPPAARAFRSRRGARADGF